MVIVILGVLIFLGLGAVAFFAFQFIKEIKPTINEAKSTAATLQKTIQESKEIGDHFKTIADVINIEKEQARMTVESAKEAIVEITKLKQVAQPVGEALALLKRRTEPKPLPVKTKNLMESVQHRMAEAWENVKKPVQKRFSKRERTKRRISLFAIPLLLGTAAGGYAAFLFRRKQLRESFDLPDDRPSRLWEKIRELPSPPDFTDEDTKKKSPEMNERKTIAKRLVVFWNLLRETFYDWINDRAASLGASLAYYTVFSLSPLLIIAIAIAGFLFGREAAQGEIVRQIGGVIGYTSAHAIQELIQNAQKPSTGIIATIAGFATLIFGASGVFLELHESLQRIWNVPPKPGLSVWGLIKERFLSFTMVLGIGFLLLVSLLLSAALTALGKFMGNSLPFSAFALEVINNLVSFGVVTLLFAMIYKILPDAPIEWRDVWLGAVITSVFFVIGKFGIGLYLGRSTIGSSFGAAGSLVLILVWIYYSAQIFLFGAEFTQVFAKRRGSWSIGNKIAA